jgi:hypothetical protein
MFTAHDTRWQDIRAAIAARGHAECVVCMSGLRLAVPIDYLRKSADILVVTWCSEGGSYTVERVLVNKLNGGSR